MDSNDVYSLVKEFGQGYDVVVFRKGEELYAYTATESDHIKLLLHDTCENLEKLVCEFYVDGLSVKVVQYINIAGQFDFPDIGEIRDSQEWDY